MYESKEVCIINVDSIWRETNPFGFVHSCAVEVEVGVMLHAAFDNVTLIHNGSHVTGHIMDVIWNHITVKNSRKKVVNT